MSTRSFILKMRRGIGLFVLALLCGVLIALQLALPAVTFASPSRIVVLPAETPSPTPVVTPTTIVTPTPVVTKPTEKTGSTLIDGLDPTALLLSAGVALVVIIVVVVLLLLAMRRRQARRRDLAHFEAEEAQAHHISDVEAQRIVTANLEQRQQPAQQQPQQPQDAPAVNKASAPRPNPASTLPCPNCGQPVRIDSTYCQNCRYLLSPSASGLRLHAMPPTPSIADSPTVINPPMPQDVHAPPPPVSEMPTIQYPPNGQPDREKMQPYTVERLSGHNLSLAVGTRSDPGIKRKHKPNEDSLLAIQGARTNNAQPQQFGLFVVADGMGGHANGQDASRLAIQTIINYLAPILAQGNESSDEAFMKLLGDGVQQANQAVHQHNQEQRADMGTTMTAALVVDSMAYVANVGDSRTYLYREPAGLAKITNDHSVVASLVDAGVIKPDDIYTHPKRNQIYRSLGEKPVVEVDTFKVQLQAGDKLLLCSDGLWDMVRDPEIQRVMHAPILDPEQTGNALIKAALEGGGEDNVSVIVVQITEDTKGIIRTGFQLLAKPDTVSVPKL